MISDALKSTDLTATARKHGVTQPAITYHLKNLEKYLGCALLERHGNNYVVTQDGQDIIELQNTIESEINKILIQARKNRSNIINILSPVEFSVFDKEIRDLFSSYETKITYEDWGSIANSVNRTQYDACIFPTLHRVDEADIIVDHNLRWFYNKKHHLITGDHKIIVPLKVTPILDHIMKEKILQFRPNIGAEVSNFLTARLLLIDQNWTTMLPEFLYDPSVMDEIKDSNDDKIFTPCKFYYNLQIRNRKLDLKHIEALRDAIFYARSDSYANRSGYEMSQLEEVSLDAFEHGTLTP